MGRTGLLLGVGFIVGIAVGAIGPQILSAQPGPLKNTELLKTDLAGIRGKEGVVVLSELAPGAVAGRHYHPGDEFVYILEGSGNLEAPGKPVVAVKTGDTIYQPPKQVHNVKNTGTIPLKVLVVLIAKKGQPFIVPVK